MNTDPSIRGILVTVFFYCFLVPTYPCLGQPVSKNSLFLMAKNDGGGKESETAASDPVIEEFEKEKLAKLKRNIGRRLMFVRTNNPAVFYESPDDFERKVRVKGEKEGLVITEVVQNRSGTMNFFQVKFDSGETGYLSADGNYLGVKIKEGSLLSLPRKTSTKKKSVTPSKALASEAIELVKSHPTGTDPVTGEKRSVEQRMRNQKARFFPNLKWRYEGKEIAREMFRVTQYAGEGAGPPLIRTWIVELSTLEVRPENLAAKEMYR